VSHSAVPVGHDAASEFEVLEAQVQSQLHLQELTILLPRGNPVSDAVSQCTWLDMGLAVSYE
jgi:hypothetical protein